jgi:hypothetical protein
MYKGVRNEVAGTWELDKIMCDLCIPPVSTFPPGNGNIIVLSANGSYESKKHDTLLFSGSYTLQEKEDCFERSSNLTFSTNDSANTLSNNYIIIEDDKLTFSTPNCLADGATTIYRRIK